MADLRFALVIGDKAYSSWSLRAWLALHHASGAAGFQEINIELAGAGSDEQRAHIRKFSPNGKVPALIDRAGGGGGGAGLVVWDSLAICEFVSDCFPAAGLWPDDPRDRAVARSAAAEMHSAFGALRSAMPMNVRRHGLAVSPDEHDLTAVAQDVDRVCELWNQCRAQRAAAADGPWLFGRFSIVDCMFAPVVMRFVTYAPENLDEHARRYVEMVAGSEAMRPWLEAAQAETHRILQYEDAAGGHK